MLLAALVLMPNVEIGCVDVEYVVRSVSGGKDLLKYNATGEQLPQNKWRSIRIEAGANAEQVF